MQLTLTRWRRALRRPVVIHVLIWVGFTLYEQATFLFMNGATNGLAAVTANYLLNAAFFYANSALLLRQVAQSRYVSYALLALLALAVYALLRTGLNLHLGPLLGWSLPAAVTYKNLWVTSVYRGSFFLFASLGYGAARYALQLERQRRLQEMQLRHTENSLMAANLAFLKSQINPHFLFNSLNFLYSQVYPHSDSAARGILLLSDLMRYALQDDHNGKVMLTEEVQHLQNYIALNQLRFNQQLQVDFAVRGSVEYRMILPLVLITFVENCFKHGELADPANPVLIRLSVEQDRLTFQTRNKIRRGPKEKSTGIGLVNTRRRLDMVYPNRHNLHVAEDAGFYTCTLTMEL
ncbi:sensor histidine kinase [Hymenobacter latericus]|uniref:sensor histidine kinase n=1 Tax=Hymenobacter sp. YIM 151858-1 TaxID=2987688 RepID=UPI00222765C5|nr:histidine kinase [Hymenobacter sp. YIM 151858-1]UYZ61180.1 histidine kinase [Hymenobacter sp. YIM 151858-1]